jgi:hypothetical protein
MSAIRHLVLQAPASVIARMLGYHDDTTVQLAAEAGGDRRPSSAEAEGHGVDTPKRARTQR